MSKPPPYGRQRTSVATRTASALSVRPPRAACVPKQALSSARPGRLYPCVRCGGWHLTRKMSA